MPRTRSSKKPGCFTQVKPTLTFTDSPAERLPRRLCSPINAAENPITAQVLYLEDGLEATWVSPQFHPGMLETEEAPRRRRRGKQDGSNAGKSAMATQHTTKKRRPVRRSSRRSSVTTPNLGGERRFPKGFKPLQFLGDASRSRRDGDEWKRMEEEEEENEDVRIDEDDNDVWLEDSTTFKMDQRRKGASTKNVLQRCEHQEWVKTGAKNNSVYHSDRTLRDSSHILPNQSRVKAGRTSVTRSRTSSVSFCHLHNRRSSRDDDVGEGDFHQPSLIALRKKPLTRNANQGHHVCNQEDLPVSPDDHFEYTENFSKLGINDWCPHENENYHQSPKFNQSKRNTRGDSARKKLEKFAADKHFTDVSLRQEEQYLLADLKQTGHDPLHTCGEVLAADTPVSDYGLRVSLRRRRHLLPKHYTERLLLDS